MSLDPNANTTAAARPRLLIFIVAYFAESTLTWVLGRIPRTIFEEYECEILVVDDASTDRTFEIGHEYRRSHPEVPLRVLRNRYNQGYGGNQKIGYAYAIKHGFQVVALVHGDGQYAPEELPRLISPLVAGECEAVFGSRMLAEGEARKGGMPLYKYAGNRILSTLQNALLSAGLSEFHSGYRIYSVRALSRLPFRLNSNDFHFDTEIIIQLLNASMRIRELPIPTYYGSEICRVNGIPYAWNVMRVTIQNALHRAGLLYQRRFDPHPAGNEHYDLKLGYASSHSMALSEVPAGSRVLDIGSGPGGLARELRARGCDVAVVDQHPPSEAVDIPVYVQDLDGPLVFTTGPYTHLLLLDILEHLKDPEDFLYRLRQTFTDEPKTVIVTTPNIAFAVLRLMLLFGQFNYGKAGILDRTHTRLFTFRGLTQILKDEGFRIRRVDGVPAPFPKALGDNGLGRFLVGVNGLLIRLSKTLFSYQIFVVAETTPPLEYLLESAEGSDSREKEAFTPGPTAAA